MNVTLMVMVMVMMPVEVSVDTALVSCSVAGIIRRDGSCGGESRGSGGGGGREGRLGEITGVIEPSGSHPSGRHDEAGQPLRHFL